MHGVSMTLEQRWLIGLLLTLAIVSIVAFRRWFRELRQIPRPIVFSVIIATVVSLLIRVFFVEPAFVHISLHGPLIVESILQFPDPATHRQEFGPGGFVILGALASAFGRSAETVLLANGVLSAMTTPIVAIVAACWTKRISAAPYAAAAWATSPFIARLARSEDVHSVAILFVLLSFVWIELALARRSALALFGAVLSMLVSIWTRQTMYPFAVMFVTIFFERWLRTRNNPAPALATWKITLACVAVLVALGVRLTFTFRQGGDSMILPVLLEMLRQPSLILHNLIIHPLFSPARLSILFPTLGLVGLVFLVKHSPVRWSFVLIAAGILFESLPSAYRSIGVSWAFRMPIYSLAIIAIGAGGAALEETIARRFDKQPTTNLSFVLQAMCGLFGLLATATAENRRPNAEFVEYTYVRDTLQTIRRPFTFVALDLREPHSMYATLARRLDVPVVLVRNDNPDIFPTSEPFIFYAGIRCHAFALPALYEASLPSGKATDADIHKFLVDAHDPRKNFGANLAPPPTDMQRVCSEIIARSDTRLPRGPIVHVEEDPPMVLFDKHDISLGFFTLTPPPPWSSP